MSQFQTTFRGRAVDVHIGGATEPHESLEGVEVYYCDTGEEINVDKLSINECSRLHEEVAGEYMAWQIDATMR